MLISATETIQNGGLGNGGNGSSAGASFGISLIGLFFSSAINLKS
jgi:hypothetical protein